MGFNIAARVLEVITKKPFDRLIQEKLFRPLAMRNSTFANEDYNDAVNAAMGCRSTAADYINFLSMLLNKGSFNNKVFLTEESLNTMFKKLEDASKIQNMPKATEGWDYGTGEWIMESTASGKSIALSSPSLNGSWPVLDICRQYGFILLTKPSSADQNKVVINSLKAAVDESFSNPCNN
jgi:CubicO group peptidase (beta-lactamase class C family)